MRKRLLALSYTLILCLLITSLASPAEIRKLGEYDLSWGPYGTTWTSTGGKSVRYIPRYFDNNAYNDNLTLFGKGLTGDGSGSITGFNIPLYLSNYLSVNDAITVWVNVQYYGFSSTATAADNKTAIDNAVADGWKWILIPPGRYDVAPFTITSSVRISGGGWWNKTAESFGGTNMTSKSDTYNGGTILYFSNTTDNCITLGNSTHPYTYQIEDLMIIGPGTGTSVGIQLGTGSAATVQNRFRNVGVYNFYKGMVMTDSQDGLYDHLIFRGNYNSLTMESTCNNNLFTFFEGQRSVSSDIHALGGTQNRFLGGLIQNADNNGIVIDASVDLYSFENFWFENNNISGTSGAGAVITTANAISANNLAFKYCRASTDNDAFILSYGNRISLEDSMLTVVTIGSDVSQSYDKNTKFATSLTNNSAAGFQRLYYGTYGTYIGDRLTLTDQTSYAQFYFAGTQLLIAKPGVGNIYDVDLDTGNQRIYGDLRVDGLPTSSPGAGSKKLWYDTSDNTVKYAP